MSHAGMEEWSGVHIINQPPGGERCTFGLGGGFLTVFSYGYPGRYTILQQLAGAILSERVSIRDVDSLFPREADLGACLQSTLPCG